MSRVFTIVLCLFAVGCQHKGVIRSKGTTVVGVPDAGKPARLDSDMAVATLPIPAGSSVTVTKFEASSTEPAKEVTRVDVTEATEWRKTENRIAADTGTVDTTVAKHRIDVAASKPLLFAAIGAMVAAGAFLYLKYPTPALMCGAASVVFFLAWKLSDLPSWFYVIGVGGIVGAIALHRGYERREKEEKERAEELAKAKAIAVVVPHGTPAPGQVNPPTP